MIRHFLRVSIILFIFPAIAHADQNFETFNAIFKNWSDAFDHKDLKTTCSLFSPQLEANYQGHSRHYTQVCDGLKKLFSEKNVYHYRYKLQQVYRSGNLAAVRITWYFLQEQDNKSKIIAQDEGIDIFKRDHQGKWQIINYLAFQVK